MERKIRGILVIRQITRSRWDSPHGAASFRRYELSDNDTFPIPCRVVFSSSLLVREGFYKNLSRVVNSTCYPFDT
jgi:hypothetical protein